MSSSNLQTIFFAKQLLFVYEIAIPSLSPVNQTNQQTSQQSTHNPLLSSPPPPLLSSSGAINLGEITFIIWKSVSCTCCRMGFSLALGALPLSMLKGCLMDVINGLIASTKIRDKEEKMAEARRDAVKALAR